MVKRKENGSGAQAARAALFMSMEQFLRERLGSGLVLEPFATESSKVVYRAQLPDGHRLFVKLYYSACCERSRLLAAELDLPFVPKVVHLFPWGGRQKRHLPGMGGGRACSAGADERNPVRRPGCGVRPLQRGPVPGTYDAAAAGHGRTLCDN